MDIIIVDDEAEIDGKLPRLLELRSHVGTAPIEEKPSTSVGGERNSSGGARIADDAKLNGDADVRGCPCFYEVTLHNFASGRATVRG